MNLHLGTFWHLLRETARDWAEHKALRLSAALAYYSVFSMAPLLLICLAVAGWVFGPEAARGHVQSQLQDYLGPPMAAAVESFIRDAGRPAASVTAALIGFVTLLMGAAGVFAQLKDALNTIWDVPATAGGGIAKLLKGRLGSFALVLGIGVLLLASVVGSTLLASLTKNIPLGEGAARMIANIAGSIVSFAMVTVLFAAIFKFLPDVPVRWRHVWAGALFTAFLFELGKFGLGFYLGRESTTSAYGAAASVVLVLLWVYYASLILFFGAVFTKVRARGPRSRRDQTREKHAQPPPQSLPAIPQPSPVLATAAPGTASWVLAGAAAGLALGLAFRASAPSR